MPNNKGLRPEARSVGYRELSVHQRVALARLIDLLGAAVDDLPSVDDWRLDPQDDPTHDDEQRASRVLFLDGERGSGKTTVAASLRQCLRSGKLGADHEEDDVQRNEIRELEQSLHQVMRRVILLETLGLENAPSDTNILAALLARIEHELFPALSQDDGGPYMSQPDDHTAVLKLLRLQTDVALAWNGNLEQRMGQLDPDNYAMEELRVERVRLQLRKRFASTLRATARDALGYSEPALFLLVVDDVDLNPDHVIELVERLRMVGVAELAVLLIGDIDVLETVFRLEYAAKFQGGRRSAVVPRLFPDPLGPLEAMTNDLALSALRKHVPARQRVKLRLLEVGESLNLVPLRRQGDGKRLRDLLAKGMITWGPPAMEGHAMTVGEFIAHAAGLGQNWYVGSNLLVDNARTIVDLWNLMESVLEDESHSNAGSGAVILSKESVVALRDFAAEIGVQRLANSRIASFNTGLDAVATRKQVDRGNLSPLDITARHTFVIPHDVEPGQTKEDWIGSWARPRTGDLSESTVAFSRSHGIVYHSHLGPDGTSTSVSDLVRLDPVEIGPLVVAEDLQSTIAYGPFSESIVVRCKRTTDLLAWVREIGNPVPPGAEVGRAWPIPYYRLMRQVEEFGYRWNAFLDGSTAAVPAEADLALAWVMLHSEILAGQQRHAEHTMGHLNGGQRQDQVLDIFKHLEDIQGAANEVRSDWAVRVAADWLPTAADLLRRFNLAPGFGSQGRNSEALDFVERHPLNDV